MSDSKHSTTGGKIRGASRIALVALAATLATTVLARPAGASQAFPTTNDQDTTISIPWSAYNGQTPSQISSLLTTNNARLTEIRVEDPSTPTFDVTMVQNTGYYASGWYWWYDVSASTLGSDLSSTNSRLISLEPYLVGGNLEFAAVAVPNTGTQNRSWWWYYGASQASINSTITANNARLISLRPYSDGGVTAFAVIEISNTGIDNANDGWWYSFNQTPTQISAQLNADTARLISIAADPTGGFDTIYLGSEGEYWSWWYGLSASQFVSEMNAYGDRPIDFTSYPSGSTRVYAGVGLDDTNVTQSPINTASTNVSNYANANGWNGGFNGASMAPASAPGSPVVAYNGGFRFETASTIKVLYLLYALQQVQAAKDSLKSSFTYYVDPSDPTNPDVCPNPAWEVAANKKTTSLNSALQLMMRNSDNRVTRGMELRYGIANVQAMATGMGLAHTFLRQSFIGCGFEGGVRNELTLQDAATLYAAVSNKTALTAKYETIFFNTELGGVPSSTDYLVTVIDQEAAKLGKTSVESQFAADVVNHWKAGSYSFCMSSACTDYKADFSIAGRMTLPFKNSRGVVRNVAYVYGDFVNDLYVPCAPGSGCSAENAAYAMIGQVSDEAARGPIDSALATW